MRCSVALLVLFVGFAFRIAHAQDKPAIYNPITDEGSRYDQLLHDAYTARYSVMDLADATGYLRPKVLSGDLPKEAAGPDGKPLTGYVLVGYIVATNGRALDPVILKSTDERLNKTALKATESWKFDPASLDGKPIATTAAQEFVFGAAKSE